ncbi:uncharacterized mitochondrial protein AtMg00810-like [Malus sylvestris]|uniref:uncharacterized mitochondrial protein AtMg00810-like n=1 Tax=Malus sylvestris TaxID=3752 RepID=UPI0021AD2257|nr:uncharacterized mitochondrial protein AtMg00810-like [Malus sylvestris]
MDDVLQTELGTEPIILRDTNQSATDDDRLPAADISDELPSDDRLPAADMSNELPDDGSVYGSPTWYWNISRKRLKYFLGIEVARSKHGIFLSQRKYVLDLLAETGMLDCKPVDTPIEQNHRLGLFPDQVPTHKERYQRLVGRLIYLSHTRPDIAYAVSVVSQFMHSPSEAHMDAVTRILRYLKMAPGRGLIFSKNDHLNVEGYTDADWAGSITDRRSTSGYFMFVGGNLVTWRSKKQKVVARSSAEAEFRGMSHGVCELLWLEKLLRDLGFKHKGAMKLHCDNKAAIEIAQNPVQHDRTKHVEIDRHFIKEKLDAGIIMFPFVRSEDQLADALTKAVSNSAFSDSLDNSIKASQTNDKEVQLQ